MKPEEQRIAIAEWCGWTLMDVADGTKFSNPEEPLIVQRWVNKDLGILSRKLPDYLNDLNAMWEAEEKLRDNQFHYVDYSRELFKVVSGKDLDKEGLGYFTFNFIHATAAQRAEALLRTIGKWTDSTLHTKG